MIKRMIFGIGRILLPLLAGAVLPAGPLSAQPVAGRDLASRRVVEYLASDALKGRFPGTEGDSLAARMIAEQFRALGLVPVSGKRGDYYQEFELLLSREAEEGSRLTFLPAAGAGTGESPVPAGEFFPAAFSGSGSYRGPVAEAGFGLQIKEGAAQRDDYRGTDVRGKCAVIRSGYPVPPMFRRREMPPQMAAEFERLADPRNKALLAQDMGAAAVILLCAEDETLRWESTREFALKIPVVLLKQEEWRNVCESCGVPESAAGSASRDGEEAADFAGVPESSGTQAGTRLSVDLQVAIGERKAVTRNIAGMIPGRSDEYIIVGAHYDHLGYGGPGSGSRRPDTVAVHNGADDNASGVAGMLAVARDLGLRKGRPQRGLIFVAFGAEEEGVVGSRYFAEHLPVPADRVSAMVNFDMIGNLREGALSVGGTGTSAESDSLLRAVSEARPGFRLKCSPEGHGPSDHAPFYAKGIPVFYFTTGATMDYHTPADDSGRLNYAGLDSVAAFAGELVARIAAMPEKLSFREAGNPQAAPVRTHFKVTLGLMPDVTGSERNGLRAEVVVPGKPAWKAGLKSGDVIVEINGAGVSNIEDYMARLGALRAGEKVPVKVRRGEETLLFEVQL